MRPVLSDQFLERDPLGESEFWFDYFSFGLFFDVQVGGVEVRVRVDSSIEATIHAASPAVFAIGRALLWRPIFARTA